jgi:hypothetical protein
MKISRLLGFPYNGKTKSGWVYIKIALKKDDSKGLFL